MNAYLQFLWNQNFHYRVYKSPPQVAIPHELSPHPPDVAHIYFNIILPSTLSSSEWPLSTFQPKISRSKYVLSPPKWGGTIDQEMVAMQRSLCAPTKFTLTLIHIYLPYACYILRPSHPPWLRHTNNFRCTAQNTQLLVNF
jgi:hypothetical protein